MQIKKDKIRGLWKNWKSYALIGLCNIAIPFVLIAIGTGKINSYLAAILMSTTPLSGSILALFLKDEKFTLPKFLGVLIGFSGIILLFFDKIIINNDNYVYVLITILGSTFYCIGGLLTLRLKNIKKMKMLQPLQLYGQLFFYFHFL